MKYGRRLIILLMLMLAVAIPARAAEQVDLPDIKDFNAANFELAAVVNGQLFVAGRGQIEAPTRAYLTVKSIPLFPGDEVETQEIVVYDDLSYYRRNNETQWYYEDYGGSPSEDLLIAEIIARLSTVHFIQSMPIAGVPTNQYQAWVGSDEFGYFKLDFWLGQSTSYIHQLQDTTVIYDDDDPDELDDNVAFIYRFDSFEGGQKVYRPAGAIPSDEDPGVLRSPVRAGGLLGTLDRLGRLAVR